MSQTEPAQGWGQPLPDVAGPPAPPAPAPDGGSTSTSTSGSGSGSTGKVSTSTIVLLAVSGLLLLVTFWTFVGLLWAGPATLAVVALTRGSADPAGARRLTRIGWWVTAGLGVLGVLLAVLVGAVVWLLLPSSTSSGYDSSTVGLTTTTLQALATPSGTVAR